MANPSVPAVRIPLIADTVPDAQPDFNIAATSLVDLSHLQETVRCPCPIVLPSRSNKLLQVVWLVNQLHRHQDEISILQNRRDVDIPTIKAQLFKQRCWMVDKKYTYMVRLPLQKPLVDEVVHICVG